MSDGSSGQGVAGITLGDLEGNVHDLAEDFAEHHCRHGDRADRDRCQ